MYPGFVVAVFINRYKHAIVRRALAIEMVIWKFLQTVERNAIDEINITVIVINAFG